LRDLDGETLAYSNLAESPEPIVDFIERIFRRPWEVVGRLGILIKTIRRVARSRTLNPIRWFFMVSANFHCFLWSRAEVCAPRTYRAGTESLDPQYFDPVALTDASGAPAEWLKPYLDRRKDALPRWATEPDALLER
jgi:hypothetical protein